jgi:hypothetical protein
MPIDKNSPKYKEYQETFKLIAQARKVMSDSGLKGGTVECPKCKGSLNWSKHSNGHIWAKCASKDCIGWME